MHLCPGNVVAIGRAVVYHGRAAHTFSAGIICRHCSTVPGQNNIRAFIFPVGSQLLRTVIIEEKNS